MENRLHRITPVLKGVSYFPSVRPETFHRASGTGRSASRATDTGSRSSSALHIAG